MTVEVFRGGISYKIYYDDRHIDDDYDVHDIIIIITSRSRVLLDKLTDSQLVK